jgi:hypothetical protein
MVEACKHTYIRLLVLVCHHPIQDITANKLGTFQNGKNIFMLICSIKHLTQTSAFPLSARLCGSSAGSGTGTHRCSSGNAEVSWSSGSMGSSVFLTLISKGPYQVLINVNLKPHICKYATGSRNRFYLAVNIYRYLPLLEQDANLSIFSLFPCIVYILPCGGALEYLHRSPASRRRRRKGNPVPGGITGPPCHWGT